MPEECRPGHCAGALGPGEGGSRVIGEQEVADAMGIGYNCAESEWQ
jgi:hypothetical protein